MHRFESSSARGADGRRAPVILVVEDNPVIREVARELLRDLGFAADVAADGQSAVDLARDRRYDVIFMDVHMPVLDGLAAAREICAHHGEQRPWIVAMTASVMPHERRSCLDAGMDEFLSKPLTGEKFAAVLTRFGPLPGPRPGEAPHGPELAAVRDLLVALAAGEPAAFVAARQQLLDSLTRDFADLERALAAGDPPRVRSSAHSLIGVTLSVGLVRVGQLVRAIEAACVERQPATMTAAFAALAPLWADTLAGLRGLTP
jgi:CheY-like chemotaxis protein